MPTYLEHAPGSNDGAAPAVPTPAPKGTSKFWRQALASAVPAVSAVPIPSGPADFHSAMRWACCKVMERRAIGS